MGQRQNFSIAVRRTLALRVGTLCSHPDCCVATTGPTEDPSGGYTSIGVAAHITAASPGGPRYDESLPDSRRVSAENGIWLCQNHAKEIDDDPRRYGVELLLEWKRKAENRARLNLGRVAFRAIDTSWLPLYLPSLKVTDQTRLTFAARATPFVGRQSELEALNTFLAAPGEFLWMVVSGPAGSGKSRLLLEHCLEVAQDWKAGFIDHNAGGFDWWRWRPSEPTLMVLDYASSSPTMVREILAALSPERHPGARLRLVMLDRAADTGWERRLLGRERHRFLQTRCNADVSLGALSIDDARRLRGSILGVDETLWSPAEKVSHYGLNNHAPLFLAMASYAIAAGKPAERWGPAELIRDWLQRERQMYWQPNGLTESEIRLQCLAAIAGAIPADVAFSSALADCGIVSTEISPERYKVLSGSEPWDTFTPLEPDVLAEWVVLDTLERLHPQSGWARGILQRCWSLSASRTAGFIARIVRDFPAHRVTLSILSFVPQGLSCAPEVGLESAVTLATEWSELLALTIRGGWAQMESKDRISLLNRVLSTPLEHPDLERLRYRLGDPLFDDPLCFSGVITFSLENKGGWDFRRSSQLALRLSNIRHSHATNLQFLMIGALDTRDLIDSPSIASAAAMYLDHHWRDRQVRGPAGWTLCDYVGLTVTNCRIAEACSAWRSLNGCYLRWLPTMTVDNSRGPQLESKGEISPENDPFMLTAFKGLPAGATIEMPARVYDCFVQDGPSDDLIVEVLSKATVNLLLAPPDELSDQGISANELFGTIEGMLLTHGPQSGLPQRLFEIYKDQIFKLTLQSEERAVAEFILRVENFVTQNGAAGDSAYIAPLAIAIGKIQAQIRLDNPALAGAIFDAYASAEAIPDRIHADAVVPVLSILCDISSVALRHHAVPLAKKYSDLFWGIRRAHMGNVGLRTVAMVVARNTTVICARGGDLSGAIGAMNNVFEELAGGFDAPCARHALYAFLEYSRCTEEIDSALADRLSVATVAILNQAGSVEHVQEWFEALNMALNLLSQWYDTKPALDTESRKILAAYSATVVARYADGVAVVREINEVMRRLSFSSQAIET